MGKFWEADETVDDGESTCEVHCRFDGSRGLASCLLTIGPRHVPSTQRRRLLLQQRPYSIPLITQELRLTGFEVVPVPDGMPPEGRFAVLTRRPTLSRNAFEFSGEQIIHER